jgi:hypothetical protein
LKKPLTIGLSAAALIAGALSLVKVDGSAQAPAAVITEAVAAESEAPPVIVRLAQLAPVQPYILDYERGPRIIQVPQSGERGNVRTVSRAPARASVERRPEPAAVDDDDDEVQVAPPPRKPRLAAPPPQPPAATTPRWKLRSETPSAPTPPSGPRRAVLSAPPLSAGPTPLRPTPNFDNKAADRGEKFGSPRAPVQPAAVVSETQPPLGYSPPAMPEQPSDDVPAAAEAAAPPLPDNGPSEK